MNKTCWVLSLGVSLLLLSGCGGESTTVDTGEETVEETVEEIATSTETVEVEA